MIRWALTSSPRGFVVSSIVRITSICPLPKMLPDHALDPVLQWEESDRVRPDQEADAFASSLRAHPSHSVRLRGARLWGCYRNGNNQSQSISRLDHYGQAVTAGGQR